MNNSKRGGRAFRRKNYFIKKSFQAKFFVGFVALLVIEALLIAGLFMRISGQTLTTGYSGSRLVIDKTSSFFFVNFTVMCTIVGIAVGLAGMFVFIFLSHKIAGPLYRFESVLKDLAKGNLTTRINLRKSDQLEDIKNTFNAALESADERLTEVKKDLDEAHYLASQLGSDKEAKNLKDAIARAKERIEFFRTS